MRTVHLARLSAVEEDITRIAQYGPAGGVAATYLRQVVAEERLTARSFAIYRRALEHFAREMGATPKDEMWGADALARFFATLGANPWALRSADKVLRRFIQFCGGDARTVTTAAQRALARGGGATSLTPDETLSVLQLDLVAREAERVIASAAGKYGAGTATEMDLLRAALVAMCRHAGALAGDLPAVTFDDIAPAGRWNGTVGPLWRTVRVLAGATGADKSDPVELVLPDVAQRAIARWLTKRPGTVEGSAPVFVQPDSPAPLSRTRVWAVVAGEGDPTAGVETAQHLPETLADGSARPERIEIRPSLLRHCLGVELVRETTGGRDLWDRLAARMGVRGRGLDARYRKLLGFAQAPRRRSA